MNVEELSRKFHEIYQIEAKRFGFDHLFRLPIRAAGLPIGSPSHRPPDYTCPELDKYVSEVLASFLLSALPKSVAYHCPRDVGERLIAQNMVEVIF